MTVEMHALLYVYLLTICCRFCYWIRDREVAEKDKRIAKLEQALHELCSLKKLKDSDGKTSDYLKRQPKAWTAANNIIVK